MPMLTNYSQRIAATGLGTKEGLINRSKHELRNEFERTINVHFLTAIEPNGQVVQKRIQTYREQNKVDRILSHPDEVLIEGTILLDLLGNDWIIIKTYWRGEVNQVAEIMQLRYKMKWMNSTVLTETRIEVISEPSIRGITDNPFFTIPDNMIYVMMQADSSAKQIKRDQRLMVLGVPYKVTKIDKTSFTNVLIVHLLEDLLGTTDTDEVCDYIAPSPVTVAKIVGPAEIVKDRYRKYTFTINDLPETEIINWSLSNNTDFTLEVLGQTAKVNAVGPIGATTTLTATSINGSANLQTIIRSLV